MLRRAIHVQRARSEATDLEDRVLSAIHQYAGELHGLVIGNASGELSPFQGILAAAAAAVEQDPDVAKLLEEIPQALGSGALLHALFDSLFSAQARPVLAMAPGFDVESLIPREIQVLQELARGRQQTEIAASLGCSVGTVRTHINRIYNKLGVGNSQEAVNKARALGVKGLGVPDLVESLRVGHTADFTRITFVLLERLKWGVGGGITADSRRFAALGATLLLMASLEPNLSARMRSSSSMMGQGVILVYSPDGELTRELNGGGCLGEPCELVTAPDQAAKEGFTPGNLFVVDTGIYEDALNGACVVELTPQGEYIRAFTGGTHYSSNLGMATGIAFAANGRLLVSTCASNSVLEFTRGGSVLRPLVQVIPYGGIAVGKEGQIYVSGGWALRKVVHVCSPEGEYQRTLEHAKQADYGPIALDDRDCLYVVCWRTGQIHVYDPDCRRAGILAHRNILHPRCLAAGPPHRLYVLEEDQRTIHALDTARRSYLFSFEAPPGMRCDGLCVSPDGSLFVGACRE